MAAALRRVEPEGAAAAEPRAGAQGRAEPVPT